VVVNEAVELAKRYSTTEAGRFVNGVLRTAAQAIRQSE
jgi:transcription termination factor NusB